MAEVTIGEETFHVELEGDEGKPVILLSNALGTNLSMWDAQMPALLEHYRVLRYDSRGHGESSVPDGPYTINLLGQDALGILDALGIEQADFIGLSLGGFVGQWLLLHAPERIGKAVLSNTASQIGNEDMWNDRIQTAFHDGMAPIASGLIEAWFTREFREKDAAEVSRIEKMILATQTEGYTATCAALRDADLRNEIAEIKTPVLVIAGRHDIVTPTGIGALIASAIDGAKLVTIDAAHLSNVGDPEEFNKEALAFLVGEGASAVMEEPAMAEDDDVIVEEATIEVPETKAEAKPKAPRKPRVKKAPVEEASHSDEPAHETAEPTEEHASEEASEPEEPVVLAPKPKKPRAKKAPKAIEAAPEPLPVDDDPPGENAEADDFTAPEPAPKRSARRTPVKKAAAKKAPVKKAPVKKAAAKKAPAKTAAVKKAAVKKAPAKKAAVKKVAAKKAVAKKAPVKKAAVKKTAVKKTAVKSSARKGVGKTSPVKKTAVKKTTARKGAIKVAAKKTAVKKSVVKKSAVKKSAVKKTVAKKAAVKKAAPKKTAVKKTAVKKTALRAAPKKAVKKAPARKTAAKKAKRR